MMNEVLAALLAPVVAGFGSCLCEVPALRCELCWGLRTLGVLGVRGCPAFCQSSKLCRRNGVVSRVADGGAGFGQVRSVCCQLGLSKPTLTVLRVHCCTSFNGRRF